MVHSLEQVANASEQRALQLSLTSLLARFGRRALLHRGLQQDLLPCLRFSLQWSSCLEELSPYSPLKKDIWIRRRVKAQM